MADVANSKLLQQTQGIPNLKDALVVLVKTEWNANIADELENGCRRVLQQYNAQVKTLVVPGAVEIGFAIKQCWEASIRPLAFVALGAVIRGETPHFDYVCQAVTNCITQLNLSIDAPVIFGVLTVNNASQAQERLGGEHGHKGEEAALTAIKMIALQQQLKEGII